MPRFITLIRFLFVATVLAAASGCATNPVSGESELVMLSERQEIELGRENDPKIKKRYGLYDDARLQAYVQRLGAELAAKSHRKDLSYQFIVLDSDEINAFALPGGYIYITRGILSYLNSEAELAAVLGHEIGHVTARHSVRQYTRAVGATIGATVLSIFVPSLGNQAGQELMNVIGGAMLSGYGREDELEADRLGAQYLALGGYDPQAMIGVVGVLKNQEEYEKKRAKEEGREPRIYHGVFASHPSADRRLQEVVGEAEKLRGGTANRTGRDEFLAYLDGLVFGDSVSQGVSRGRFFYHRDLNATIAFPEGWRLKNSPQFLSARADDGAAIMQVIARPVGKHAAPADFLRDALGIKELRDSGPPGGFDLPAYSGIARIGTPLGRRDARVTAVYHKEHAFVFFGAVKDESSFARHDALFLDTARSLRALRDAAERRAAEGLRLRVRTARAGETFAALARRSPLEPHAESTLRLINDRFPAGEPVAGQKIKVIE